MAGTIQMTNDYKSKSAVTETPLEHASLDTRYGAMSAPVWPEDLIVRALRAHGEWGAVETELAARVIRDGCRLWDVGAFLGTFSLGVTQFVTPGAVVAIEANRALLPYLTRNLRRGLPCSAEIVAAGVGARRGWLTPTDATADKVNHGAQAYEYHGAQEGEPDNAVPCFTLAGLRRVHGDYDALKLDIEGAELDALKGDYTYIKENQPVLWIECNETPQSLELLSALRSLGYAPLYLAFPAFRRDNFRGNPDLIHPMAFEAALVAARPGVLDGVDWQVAGEEIIMRPVMTHGDLRRALFDTPRWSRQDWLELGRAELIARLGRGQRGQTLAEFLRSSQRT